MKRVGAKNIDYVHYSRCNKENFFKNLKLANQLGSVVNVVKFKYNISCVMSSPKVSSLTLSCGGDDGGWTCAS